VFLPNAETVMTALLVSVVCRQRAVSVARGRRLHVERAWTSAEATSSAVTGRMICARRMMTDGSVGIGTDVIDVLLT